jgi:hypothetical protein
MRPSRVAPNHRTVGCRTRRCTSLIRRPVLGLIPAPIKPLCGQAKLNNRVSGEVLRRRFTPLLLPQPHQGGLIASHDDPGVRPANEGPAVLAGGAFPHGRFHASSLSNNLATRSRYLYVIYHMILHMR